MSPSLVFFFFLSFPSSEMDSYRVGRCSDHPFPDEGQGISKKKKKKKKLVVVVVGRAKT